MENRVSDSLPFRLQPGTQQYNIIPVYEIPTPSLVSKEITHCVNTVYDALKVVLNSFNTICAHKQKVVYSQVGSN